MKLFSIEEDFISLLTKIVWWASVRVDRGTVWLSLVYVICSSTVIHLLFAIDSFNYTIQKAPDLLTWILFSLIVPIIGTILHAVIVWAFFIFMFTVLHGNVNILKNTKETPNPNRHTNWIWACRIQAVLPFVMGIIQQNVFIASVSVVTILAPALYMLCADPIPPGKKKEMREEIENKRLQLSPQKN